MNAHAPRTADAILDRLQRLHPKKIDLSLGRTQALLDRIGNPERRLPRTVHVAGTNGKGSTIAFMRAALEAQGRRVHVYTSPHLVRFHERIRLAGTLVSESQLTDALDRCETANGRDPVTLWEITTAAAFLLFSEVPADDLLLEVGLGGRLDSTNVVEHPAGTVITTVSFDHPEYLGTTLPAIAAEKAGILKRGAAAVFSRQAPEALAVLERVAARLGVRPHVAGEHFSAREEHGRLIFEDERGLVDLPLPRLVGRHQHENAGTAIATLRELDAAMPIAALERAMGEATWPARMQRLSRGPLVEAAPVGAELWLDGGHNEDGARALAQALADLDERAPRPVVLICGMLATKDTPALLRAFHGLVREVMAVPIAGEHASRSADEIAGLAQAIGLTATACENVPDALAKISAREWPTPPRITMAGSLYLAGEVLALNGALPG